MFSTKLLQQNYNSNDKAKATVRNAQLKLKCSFFCVIFLLTVITLFVHYGFSFYFDISFWVYESGNTTKPNKTSNVNFTNGSQISHTDSFYTGRPPLRASHSQTCQSAISSSHNDDVMHFAVASCGMSVHIVGVALIKSFVIFSKPDDVIVLHVFVSTDSEANGTGDLLEKV